LLTRCSVAASALQITTVDEASQFYPLFGLGANVALIFSGRAVKIFSQIRAELPPDVDGWGLSLRGLMGMVVIGGLLIAGRRRRCCWCWS
jgi:AAA family ATP:ADP antiporter